MKCSLTVALYVRVSTNKASQKDSPEHQLAVIKEKALQENFNINENLIYSDTGTGTTIIDRPEIQRLIADAKNGCFHVVIFAALSRFSRDTLDALMLKRTLVDSLGIRLISLDEGYDSNIDKDELKFQIISAVNQKLSEQISLASRRGIRESAKSGNFTGSLAPYGYKKTTIGKRKTLMIDEEKKDIVELIFDLYVNAKLGEKAIVTHLNEIGIPSPKDKTWGITTIQKILQNEVYIGKNVFSKYSVKKQYPDHTNLNIRKKVLKQNPIEQWQTSTDPYTHKAIITEELFIKARKLRLERGGGKRGGNRNKVNIFAGFIKCKHCGSSMVSMKSGGKSKKSYRYLICSKRRRMGEKGCNNNFWLSYHAFLDELLKQLSIALRSVTTAEQLLERYKENIIINTNDFESKLKQIQKNIIENRNLLFRLRKEKMLGNIDNEQYEFEKQQYEQEIRTFEMRLNKFQLEDQKKDDIAYIHERIKEALNKLLDLDYDQFDQLHLTLRKFIKRIEVNKHGNIEVFTTFGIP